MQPHAFSAPRCCDTRTKVQLVRGWMATAGPERRLVSHHSASVRHNHSRSIESACTPPTRCEWRQRGSTSGSRVKKAYLVGYSIVHYMRPRAGCRASSSSILSGHFRTTLGLSFRFENVQLISGAGRRRLSCAKMCVSTGRMGSTGRPGQHDYVPVAISTR